MGATEPGVAGFPGDTVGVHIPAQVTVTPRGRVAVAPAAGLKARRIKLCSRTSIFGFQRFQGEMLTGAAGGSSEDLGALCRILVPQLCSQGEIRSWLHRL